MDIFDAFGAALSEAALHVDDNGRIVALNEPARALVGAPAAESVCGRALLGVLHQRALVDLCEQAGQSRTPQELEIRLTLGAERHLRARAAPLPAEAGGGVLLVLADRTELMHLRTVRTEFVANVSHELRTPLAAIRAMAETLIDGAVDDPEVCDRFLGNIIREVDRLVRLSEDLLLLGRAEMAAREVMRFSLSELLNDVAERMAPSAQRRPLALERDAVAQGIWIEGDRGQLDQVFFNLIDNAIKYTPPGGRVTVAARQEGNRAVVTVEDSGIGMLSQDLPRIFERFWRADRARKFPGDGGTATGGTGLGLSIVKHIVDAHGGNVSVESELGEGSRFTVVLPLSLEAPSR